MTIAPRGYEAVLQRVRQIQARLESLSPAPEAPPATLRGAIGQTHGGFAPVDPFSDRSTAVPTEPPRALRPTIQAAANGAGVDPWLLEALVSAESDFNPGEVSGKGAIGLTQLMPGTARALGVVNPYDPAQNLAGGAKYLAQLLRQFSGDERLALAAYNAGPGAVKRYGGVPPFKETQDYVQRVMARAEALRRGRP